VGKFFGSRLHQPKHHYEINADFERPKELCPQILARFKVTQVQWNLAGMNAPSDF
jgi:hypothetical protein